MIGLYVAADLAALFRKRYLAHILVLFAILIAGWPLISLLHEIVIALAALVLNGFLSSESIRWLIARAEIDQVYASVAMQMAGNIRVEGVGIDGPIGEAFHQVLPAVFVHPDLVTEGAWASAVIEAGSSLLARTITKMATAGLFILLGTVLTWHAISRARSQGLAHISIRTRGLLVLGLVLQVRAIVAIATLPLTLTYLETMGLPHFVTKVVSSDQEGYDAFAMGIGTIVSSLAPPWLIVSSYAISLLGLLLVAQFGNLAWNAVACLPLCRWQLGNRRADCRQACSTVHHGAIAWVHAPLVVLVLLASLTGMASARTNFDYVPTSLESFDEAAMASPEVQQTPLTTPEPTPTPTPAKSHPKSSPSVVTISGGNFAYEYFVNGTHERIRGVGYNAQYQNLTPEDRMIYTARDFSAMREAGINTILGWDPRIFDQYALAAANQHDLGVVLPYHLPPDADYSNPKVRQELKNDILAWVAKYKKSPALRMWGIGNEVIHDMRAKERRKPFVEFYRETVDAVHEADPDHPIIYREAEDVFIDITMKVIKKDAKQRPWLVYGMNIFTYRLKEVLANWRRQGVDSPLIVSEFAPTGLGPRDRPSGYANMWGMMRDHPSLVIGGFMYVWTAEGPEPLDRVYGLVDKYGKPTDKSLETMSAQFLREAQAEE